MPDVLLSVSYFVLIRHHILFVFGVTASHVGFILSPCFSTLQLLHIFVSDCLDLLFHTVQSFIFLFNSLAISLQYVFNSHIFILFLLFISFSFPMISPCLCSSFLSTYALIFIKYFSSLVIDYFDSCWR